MKKRWLLLMSLLGLLLVLSVAVGTAMGSPGILYVKPSASGTGDCSSWANPCTLQHALKDVAAYGEEIWVVTGVYTPTTTGTDRTATFQLLSGVELYGGFVGTETSREQRDWESNITVLSGDIDDNDITDPSGVITATGNISGSNSYHVVTSSSVTETCVLDGFAITGGYADGSTSRDGGGMYNTAARPALINVIFSGNFASTTGGGLGGGMYNMLSDPTLANVTFTGNSAAGAGGLYNNRSHPKLTNVLFTDNSAAVVGGGMQNYASNPTLINVLFTGNHANYSGGGMANGGDSRPTMTNCIVWGNSAGDDGGGISNYESRPTMTNCTLWGNSANDDGGGMRNYVSSPTLTNCVLWGNSAPDGAQIHNYASHPPISYSLVQGCGGSGPGWDSTLGTDGGANIDADPQFVDADGLDDIIGTVDDNLRLRPGSPAIDSGDNSAVPADALDLDGDSNTTEPLPFDMDGYPRIVGAAVDMGPYEWPVFLTVGKTVINDDGGAATAADFQGYIQGTPVLWGVAQELVSGIYTVSETVPAGYSASAWSGDCAADGTITLAIGDDKTCSITNDDIAPTLTLTKTVVNNDGGTATAADFQAYVQGDPVPWGVAESVISGTYTISETVEAGYSASGWSGDCETDGTITLDIGDVKTCSVTNDDIAPTVTLTKTVINDDDGSATVSDFQAYLDGEPVPWGAPQPVIAGTHGVSESVLTGYVPTMWGGDCNEDGTITLNAGEDAVCSITNDDTLHTYVPLVLKRYAP